MEIFVRGIQRQLNRVQILLKLFGFHSHTAYRQGKGLVLIQIDSLPKIEFDDAVASGRMKFLGNLLRQGYKSHTFYSGMPCSTAAVQAELFYGVKAAVPAFGFYDYPTNRPLVMFNPEDAAEIENRLEQEGKGLFTGGSAYSNIFTGGANESHFCISNLGTAGLLKNRYPLGFIILAVLHIFSLIRTMFLMIFELYLALFDFIRGVIDGKDFRKELKFIPSRVAICIVLRELITIGAQIDVARGLPIVHLNLVGYHEQSHRRGPNSRFARWTLKGIDGSIKRIWKAAQRSTVRDYEVWIYSDHGQEDTIPYEKEFGKTVQLAVSEVFAQSNELMRYHTYEKIGFLARAGMHRKKLLTRVFTPIAIDETIRPLLIALGPMGHIYLDKKALLEEKQIIAQKLIHDANIPIVIIPCIEGKSAQVWTKHENYYIPEHADKIMDSSAPYYKEMVQDFISSCCRLDVGDLVIYGWDEEKNVYYSFANENGSHGGLRRIETEAFAFMPQSTTKSGLQKGYLRAADLRQSALELLSSDKKTKTPLSLTAKETLRIMTYNVHGCVGVDGALSPARVARVISEYQPDIVALQELDLGRSRSGKQDQAKIIANILNMEHQFNPTMRLEEEAFGDAVLSVFPMQLIKAYPLARKPRFSFLEPRGAIWIRINFRNTSVQFINTHLGLNGPERLLHTDELMSHEWLENPACANPVIMCGDFNALPGSPIFKTFSKKLVSAQAGLNRHKSTWFGRWPVLCLDHILISPDWQVVNIEVADSYLARLASDHRPLIAEVRLREK